MLSVLGNIDADAGDAPAGRPTRAVTRPIVVNILRTRGISCVLPPPRAIHGKYRPIGGSTEALGRRAHHRSRDGYPAGRPPELGGTVVEHASGGCHEPVPVPRWRRGRSDDRSSQPDVARRAVEPGVAVGEY